VVSVTGAGCSLAADACEARGLEVPPLTEESLKYATQGLPEWASFNNPADIWAAIMAEGNAGAYYRLMHAMASQDDVDMLLAVFTIAPQFEFDVAGTLNRIREEFPGKPVLVTVLWGAAEDARRWFGSLESARIPMYTSIERAVAAAGALNQYSSWLRAQH
jgi:acyl-CoA synthetase (NDP forming)